MPTSDKRELTFRAKLEDLVSRPLKSIGRQADDTKDDLEKVNLGLKKLDEKSAETTGTIKKLREEIARTGDTELIKDISKQEARLKQLGRQRRLLVGDGGDDGTSYVDRFIGAAVPLLNKAPLSPPLLTGIAAVAPELAQIVSGAVTSGVAVGAVAVGVKLATKDPAVQAAGKELGDQIGAQLTDAAKPFVPATLHAIDKVKDSFADLQPELKQIFADAAPYLDPLTDAATGFVRELLPGLESATRAAGPLIDVLAEHGPKAAQAMSDALVTLSSTAADNAKTLDAAFNLVEDGVRGSAFVVKLLGEATGFTGQKIIDWYSKTDTATSKLIDLKPATDDATTGAKDLASGATGAAKALGDWDTALQALTDNNLKAEHANISLEQAILRATEAGKQNNAGIDAGNEKAQANRDLLVSLADATRTAAAAVQTQTGSQALANEKTEEGRKAFLVAASAMGVGASEAKRLADQLFLIPSPKIKVTADTTSALDDARSIVARINNMKARISVETAKAGTFGGSAHTGFGNSTGYSTGGVVHGPGPRGVDSVKAMLAPGEVVWSTQDVDRAGGPAAVDRLRKAIAEGASAPMGLPAAWASGSSGGTVVNYNIAVSVSPTASPVDVGRATVEVIRAYEAASGKGWRS